MRIEESATIDGGRRNPSGHSPVRVLCVATLLFGILSWTISILMITVLDLFVLQEYDEFFVVLATVCGILSVCVFVYSIQERKASIFFYAMPALSYLYAVCGFPPFN